MNDLPKDFGRYQLLELVATGGMAYIFRARLRSAQGTEKELVIKQVLPHLVENREFIEMFVDEARITMPLTHGNIVQVFEFGQVEEDYFLAMEYVRGRNLETVLDRVKQNEIMLPIAAAINIAAEVAKGLDYAHRFRDVQDQLTGIIHRDVSPQNILVGYQGEVKLTDFGIAKARSRIRQTEQGIIRGKACYLSPEQAECRPMDGRSDQFSLGAVLYEMLTGVRPFEGENEIASLEKVRAAEIIPPSLHRPGIPPEVDQAVMRALSLDADLRFGTVGELQVVLGRCLHQLDPNYTSSTLADWMRKHFAEEINREISIRASRERMLQQLALAPDAQAEKVMTTGELLQMGTLDIRSQPTTAKRSRLPLVLSLLVLLLGLGLWAAWPYFRFDTGGLPDGGLAGNTVDGSGQATATETQAAVVDAGATPAGPDSPAPAKADPRRAPDKTRKPPSAFGYLNLNSQPWARVWLDGKRLAGETPMFKIRVRVGKHRLRFFNPKLKMSRVATVVVRPGRTKTVSVKLDRP